MGWSSDKTSATPTYKSGSIYKANSGATLYAVWKKVFYGDVNEDGKISLADVTKLMSMISGSGVTASNKLKGDLNGDGKLTEEDKNILSEFRSGDIYIFPVENMTRKIEVKTKPQKNTYKSGEEISTDGLQINVLYNNNVKHTLNSGFTISPSIATGSGEQKITVTVGDLSTWFYITVGNHTHSYSSRVTSAPTCSKEGLRTYSCSCGDSYIERIPKNSYIHTGITEIRNAKTATCKQEGYTGDTYCTGCSTKLKSGTAIAKTSHTYGSWEVTKIATCTVAGSRKKVCTGCSNTVTETVKALGHSFGAYISNNDATYKSDGTKTAYCSRCTETKTVSDPGSRLVVKKPYTVKVEQNSSAIRLTWNKCEGATGYRIYYKVGSTWKIALNATTKTTHTFTGLKSGTSFTLAIRPYVIANGSVIWSDYLTVTASTAPVAPVAKASSPSSGKITVSWNNVTGGQKYQLFYKSGNGGYKLYNTYDKATSLTFKNLKSGTKFTFAVRAYRTVGGRNIYSSYTPVSVTVK